MASSKVMASTSPANPDLPRQSSIHSLTVADLQSDQSKNFGSMNMDELLKNIYGDAEAFSAAVDNGDAGGSAADGDGVSFPRQGSFSLPKNVGNKTVDEVWKEIVAGSREPEMTLEDFLTKAGAVREEDVRIPVLPPPPPGFAVDSIVNATQFQAPPHMQSSQNGPGGFGVDSMGYGNGIDGRMVAVAAASGSGGSVGVGRGKRRAVEEPPVDRATQQKQRRMIKNRESAARSRERKQAYTVELESLVTQLEEENARLLREEAEQTKERFKQLMENLIPIEEKQRPPRVLRRVQSMSW
uniref:Putative ABSCISIC ACID-INSENSITIVE 5-like protein 5 n=1 Tax=Davidia involucrata TaxID=16924 RepID=A0A5B6YRX2_DAVIN